MCNPGVNLAVNNIITQQKEYKGSTLRFIGEIVYDYSMILLV
jgi:hypothetical protein